MIGMARHERPPRSAATAAAWAVLVGMGGTSVTYNIYHAVHGGHLRVGLALLYGIAPVFAAMCLSHIVAVYKGGWFMQAVVFAVMLGAMWLSIGAIAAVIGPASGHLRWLFGLVLDAAALIALRVILSERERAAAEAGIAETATAAAEAAGHEAAGAVAEAAGLRAELESTRAEIAAAGAHRERLEADLRSALESARQKRSRGKGRSAAGTAGKSAPDDEVTMEARALDLLATDLDMSGAELARRLGVTPGYGRKLRAKLTQQDRPQERDGEPAPDRTEERS